MLHSMLSYLITIILLLLLQLVPARFVKVAKITEGIDKLSADNPHNMLTPVIPDPFYGPDVLRVLINTCFARSHERYEYTVCPFNNVTQKRIGSTSIPNLLGVWGHWEFEKKEGYALYNSIRFLDGEQCGIREKRAYLTLHCDKDNFEVISVDDSVHCDFKFEMNLPLPCSMLKSAIVKSDKAILSEAAKTTVNSASSASSEKSAVESAESSSGSSSTSSLVNPSNPTMSSSSNGCDIDSLSQSNIDALVQQELQRRPESYAHLLCNYNSFHNFETSGQGIYQDAAAFSNLRSQIDVLQLSLETVRASLINPSYDFSDY